MSLSAYRSGSFHFWKILLSNEAHFDEKCSEVIGLYLNPPEKALLLCCDKKSQCRTLERTQPGRRLGIGDINAATREYIRHGTPI